jgi:hypothetical protein
MATKKMLLAEVDPELAKTLKKRLIDGGLTYREWLENAIMDYLGGRGQTNSKTQATNGGT